MPSQSYLQGQKKVSSFLKKGGEREKTKILEDYVDDNVTLSVTSFKSNTTTSIVQIYGLTLFFMTLVLAVCHAKKLATTTKKRE